jgi:hypothetical protein
VWDPAPVADPNPSAEPAETAARAVVAVAHAAAGRTQQADVGEIRVTGARNGGGADKPLGASEGSQTSPTAGERVWRGLAASDGRPFRAARLGIDRATPAHLAAVPVASPFAWGRCGLVLPRYPGTRVLLVHRDGERDDPVDVGALWSPETAPDARPGDWWLSLPAGVPDRDRASVPDDGTPSDYAGTVSNDLIDADGNRVIEVGRLVVRVGDKALRPAGDRPTPPDSGPRPVVVIEHADNAAAIVIDADGKITISAAELAINTTGNLTLTAQNGGITLNADHVDVEVAKTMDVKGR